MSAGPGHTRFCRDPNVSERSGSTKRGSRKSPHAQLIRGLGATIFARNEFAC